MGVYCSKSMKQSVIFIIVIYHPDKKILKELTSVLSRWKVIIVDNTTHNRGYGGGANIGIRQALQTDTSWVIVVNQDIQVTESGIEVFVKKLMRTPAGIAGPIEGTLDPKRWSTMLGKNSFGQKYISGSWFAVHRDVIGRIGVFYEPYFLYYEEVDMCMRAKRFGFAMMQIPLENLKHDETTSLGKGSPLHQYYLARNHLLFVERCAPLSVRVHELIRLPKTIWEHSLKKEYGALLGVKDYLFRKFGLLKESL